MSRENKISTVRCDKILSEFLEKISDIHGKQKKNYCGAPEYPILPTTIEVMQLERMERIAEGLERIADILQGKGQQDC